MIVCAVKRIWLGSREDFAGATRELSGNHCARHRHRTGGHTKVLIKLEMLVDVHRLAEVGSEMLHAAIKRVQSEAGKKD